MAETGSGSSHPGARTPIEVLRHYQQALIDQDADALADLYAPDAVHELPFLFPGMPERYDGSAQVRAAYKAAWAASPAVPNTVRTLAVHTTTDGDVLIVEQVVSGVNTDTNEPFEFPGVLVLTVRDGKITHVRDYMDGLRISHAMGRLPAVAKALEPTPGC